MAESDRYDYYDSVLTFMLQKRKDGPLGPGLREAIDRVSQQPDELRERLLAQKTALKALCGGCRDLCFGLTGERVCTSASARTRLRKAIAAAEGDKS